MNQLPTMSWDEYIDKRNDPRNRYGLGGPIGGGVGANIIIASIPRPLRPLRRPTPRPTRRVVESEGEARGRARLERHRLDAEHDRIVARLRRLR
jgi:hypothetical protein